MVELLLNERFGVGESPVWDATASRLLWCDIPAGTIHALYLESGTRRAWRFDEPVASLGLAQAGRLVVALRQSVILFDPESGRRDNLATIDLPGAEMRLNDGKVGPDGAFYVGSLDPSPAMRGALYRIDAAGDVRQLTKGLKASNGLAWTADGQTMFHSDSQGDMFIDRWHFDAANGTIDRCRRLSEHNLNIGRSDGGAFDMGNVYWSAAPSCSRLNRFGLDGSLLGWIDLPLLKPTMPCFGGTDLKTIFVLSLDSGLPSEGSDGIVALQSPVAGVPVPAFAG